MLGCEANFWASCWFTQILQEGEGAEDTTLDSYALLEHNKF